MRDYTDDAFRLIEAMNSEDEGAFGVALVKIVREYDRLHTQEPKAWPLLVHVLTDMVNQLLRDSARAAAAYEDADVQDFYRNFTAWWRQRAMENDLEQATGVEPE